MEVRAYLSYRRIKEQMTFWRSAHGHEVDILIGDHTAIEVKATRKVSPGDLKGLKALSEEGVFRNFYLVSRDKISSLKGDIKAICWEKFLSELWEGRIL
jgi:predicted AAA+ superfamily ATPase